VFFTAPDNDGKEFFIFQDAFIKDISGHNILTGGGLQFEYIIDTTVTTADKVAVLASAFPAPVKGLPDSVRRVSDVISVNTWPVDADLNMQVYVRYFADSLEAEVPEALALYKWDNGWIPLETGVNIPHNTVTTTLDSPGYIAAFLDLTKSRLISGTGQDIKSETKTGIQLLPNYPNPFNRYTTIKYHLPEAGHVVLKIYSPTGQEMVTLVNALQPEGRHEVTWQPQGLPAGLYLYRLLVSDVLSDSGYGYAETGKMMLVK
jgi:hypothetical protein